MQATKAIIGNKCIRVHPKTENLVNPQTKVAGIFYAFPQLPKDGRKPLARVNSRRMRILREQFFQQGKAQDADPVTRAKANCWLCNMRIDYDAQPGTTDASHELDHYYPVSTHPQLQEDPANFRHSHRKCNQIRGNKTASGGLGDTVADWY